MPLIPIPFYTQIFLLLMNTSLPTFDMHLYKYSCMIICMDTVDHSKGFTSGQARVNSEHYVFKCVGGR